MLSWIDALLMPFVAFSVLTAFSISFLTVASDGIVMPLTDFNLISEATFVLLLLKFSVAFIVPDPFRFMSICSTKSKQPVRREQQKKAIKRGKIRLTIFIYFCNVNKRVSFSLLFSRGKFIL